jgi:hypothetical protein
MATYLSGVTDYIPQFQPFQPDLNFYSNIMQTKQSQYDSNWNALNKMYGQYYHAELTRDENIEKKDEYLHNIEFNLKRVSQLDLSLEENVDQATQIFKPFYEDKNLVKDMAYTKNYSGQKNKAEIYNSSLDPKEHSRYWQEGVDYLDYKRQEFKDATTEEALGMQNVSYVPYVNTIEKAQQIAKDANLNVSKITWSDDHRWVIKTKNGDLLTEPLQKLFEARLGNDPEVQQVYGVKAYLDRKTYADVNAAQYGGDKNKAEMKYLEDGFNVLKEKANVRLKVMQQANSVYDTNIKDLETQIANGTATPTAALQLAQYKMNKDINDNVLKKVEDEVALLNGGNSSTLKTSNGFTNPFGDIKSLRNKVDNSHASSLMLEDLDAAADIFKLTNADVDIEADPYAILDVKQANSMQLVAAREASSKRVADYKNRLQKVKDAEDQQIKDGTAYRDENGNLHVQDDQFFVHTEDTKSGNTTDKYNMKVKGREIGNMTHNEYADPYFKSMFAILGKAKGDNKISKTEIANILGYDKNKGISLEQFTAKYNKYGNDWLKKYVGDKGVKNIKGKFDSWVSANRNLELFVVNGVATNDAKSYTAANMKMDDYFLYAGEERKWKINNAKAVEKQLMKQGVYTAYLLYDEQGNKRSEKEYNDMVAKKHGIDLSASFMKDANASYQSQNPKSSGLITSGTTYGENGTGKYSYDNVTTAAGKLWTNEKVVSPPVRLSKVTDPGTGLSVSKVSAITVNPLGNSPGKYYFRDAISDLNNFDFSGSIDKVSIRGIGKDAYDKADAGYFNKVGKSILEDLKQSININKGSGLKAFRMEVHPVAGGAGNLAAYVFYPNQEWIDKHTSKSSRKDADGNYIKDKLLTPEQGAAAMKNGFSFIMETSKFNSPLYKASFQDPLQAYVDAHPDDGITYNNIGGDPMKTYNITKNNLGTGDYIVKITYPQWDPGKKTVIQASYTSNTGYLGNNLTSTRDQVVNGFMTQQDEMNTYLHNNFTEQ